MHNFRKPTRTIHIDSYGSASLVKDSHQVQSIPKELHQSIQHVRISINNLKQQLELYVDSKEDLQHNGEYSCDASGDEEGILAFRTCKSREDKMPPIDSVSNVHVVDIFNPKTPQRLYYTSFDYSNVNNDHDTTDSSSSSSSEGFVPPKQSASAKSSAVKSSAVTPLSNHQDTLNVDNKMADSSGTVRSRSCSPHGIKVSGQQQRPLKDFSVDVIKLPIDVVTSSRNTNVTDSVQHGILSSDEASQIHTAGTLTGEDMESSMSSGDTECAESNIQSQSNAIITEQSTEPTTGNDLLCEENIEVGVVSCTQADNNTSKDNLDDMKDDLDYYSLSVDCDDHLQEVAEMAVDTTSPTLQNDTKGKSNIATSLSSSSHGDDDELSFKRSKSSRENLSSKLASSHVATELEETLTGTARSKKHVKNFKSEEYVMSSCSENEAESHSKSSMPKTKSKQYKSSLENHIGSEVKNNIRTKSKINTLCSASSESEHEELCKDVSPCKGIKSEKSPLQNTPQSNSCTIISSCSEHEETNRKKLPKVSRSKRSISTCATSTSASSTAKQVVLSSPENITLIDQHQTEAVSKNEDKIATQKLISAKRKLNMTDCSEVVTESSPKKHATKYKLRSKGNSNVYIIIII